MNVVSQLKQAHHCRSRSDSGLYHRSFEFSKRRNVAVRLHGDVAVPAGVTKVYVEGDFLKSQRASSSSANRSAKRHRHSFSVGALGALKELRPSLLNTRAPNTRPASTSHACSKLKKCKGFSFLTPSTKSKPKPRATTTTTAKPIFEKASFAWDSQLPNAILSHRYTCLKWNRMREAGQCTETEFRSQVLDSADKLDISDPFAPKFFLDEINTHKPGTGRLLRRRAERNLLEAARREAEESDSDFESDSDSEYDYDSDQDLVFDV